jgi:hypothetical protein
MAFEDLFGIYPNRNAELRSLAKQAYEFGKTIAKEPSAALSSGLDEHALKRQKSYIDYAKGMVDALHAKPLPDMPATHPVNLDINLTDPYVTFTTSVGGQAVPLNEATQLIAEYWMITAVELAKSNSASVAGSLIEFDWVRAVNNLDTLDKLINEMTERPILDLPETAEPGSGYQVPTNTKK